MRYRLPSIAFVALSLPLAGMAAISACGGDNNPANDAGPDVTTADVAPDVTKDVAAEATADASCANDADLTQFLPSADASVDVDAGGLNLTACTGCLKSSCGTDINACNQDCTCRQDIIDAVQCVAQGGSFQLCAGGALSNSNALNLFTCALGSCSAECLPPDGGVKDSGVSDAQSDGG